MSRIKSAINGSPSDSNETRPQPRLLPLTPSYNASEHEVYFNAIEDALTGDNKDVIRNIALTGGYGVGKSSILQKVVEKHADKVVQISLSTIGFSDLPETVDGASGAVVSKTNRIQKEIVKQLLYREDPERMPESRYHRIGKVTFWRHLRHAAVAATVITLAFFLAGWSETLFTAVDPYINLGAAAHLVVFIIATLLVLALGELFRNRIRIEKLSAGPATVSLSDESTTFFDEYLDEIVYFFDVTGRYIVIFEDIDRFDDPHIFETLRALNTLLNRAGQLEGRNIRFVYAIKDSIFDELGIRAAREEGDVDIARGWDSVGAEMARANRTKFFDLVIPVVPFITHRSARDLMVREMAGLPVSAKLIDLAARHLVDMRLIRNVRNEFLIFRQKVPCGEGSELGLKEDTLFAMMLYKSTHLSDFEAIKVGNSKIDDLYKDGRRLVANNLSQLAREERSIRQRLSNLDSVGVRSGALGATLRHYLERLKRHHQATAVRAITHGGQTVTDADLESVGFWEKFSSGDAPLEVTMQTPNGGIILSISRQDATEVLDDALSSEDWQEADLQRLKQRLGQIKVDREFLAHADMDELMNRDDFKLEVGNEGFSFHDLAARLESELARQLVGAGYIDRNFTLYTSTYYAERVSSQATNFIIHNVDPNAMDAYFSLTPTDVDAVLREHGESVLRERSMYNIKVLDYLLESKHAKVDLLVKALTAFGDDEQSLLQSYFADGQQQEALVRKFAQQWSGVFTFVISWVEVDEPERAKLLNAALESMDEGLDYDVDDAVRKYFEGYHTDLDVFRSEATSPELAVLIARLLVAMGARLSSLDGLAPNVRKAVVAESRYIIKRANLVTALDGHEGLALDDIKSRDRIVYDYVLGRLPEYLAALQDADTDAHSIESADAFQDILEDVLGNLENPLSEVLAAASPSCLVQNLAHVSEAAWPALADNNRFPATFENVTAYIKTVGQIDAHLAGVLRETGSIEVADGVEETDKVDLAGRLLAARVVLPEPDLRMRLVASLELENYLPVTSIQPESGQLIGLLVENGSVEDTSETFALALSADWETREFAISKSKNFASFMTPTVVSIDDVAPLVRSGAVPDGVKSVVVDRFSEFTGAADCSTLTAVAEYAVQKGKTMPVSDLNRLAVAGVDAVIVVSLLERLLPSISEADLVSVLEGLGGEYTDVSARNGKRPKLPNTKSHFALAQRLEQFGVVSSYQESGGKIRVNMKKSL
ncbi:MAG: YobI family P-loop NTPase [Thermoleophilia bacterium]